MGWVGTVAHMGEMRNALQNCDLKWGISLLAE